MYYSTIISPILENDRITYPGLKCVTYTNKIWYGVCCYVRRNRTNTFTDLGDTRKTRKLSQLRGIRSSTFVFLNYVKYLSWTALYEGIALHKLYKEKTISNQYTHNTCDMHVVLSRGNCTRIQACTAFMHMSGC